MIIPYSRTLDARIRNMAAIPRGLGARYLECIKAHDGALVAMAWRRTLPKKFAVLVDFRPQAPPVPATEHEWRLYGDPSHSARPCECGFDPPDPCDFHESAVSRGGRWFLLTTCTYGCGATVADQISADTARMVAES